MDPVIPFRWDLARRSQLGSLVDEAPPAVCTHLCEPLLPCAVRVLAFAGDADLVFVGRSPQSLFDLLSGLLFETSWLERLTLLHFSMGRRTDRVKIEAKHPQAIPALREYLKVLGLEPAAIASRGRPVTLVDWIQTGGTFRNLVELLHSWSVETGHDWNSVRRRLRVVGITEQTHNSPNTRRWQQHAGWIHLLPKGAVKNVSMEHGWWEYFAQFQYKTTISHTPERWALDEIYPGREKEQLTALRIAHGMFETGRLRPTRQEFASMMARQPAMKEGWFRDLVREVRLQPGSVEATKVPKDRIFTTAFSKVYPLYVKKAERKGRTKDEVDQIIRWLTGYGKAGLARQIKLENDFETFFAQAPSIHENASLITGVVCGVHVQKIKDPLMQKIRYLDKLIDELAKGKAMERILR
jgi:hypothetical protein